MSKPRSYTPRPTAEDRFVPLAETITMIGRSRSSIIRDCLEGRLPEPIKIGPGKKWHWRLSTLKKVMADTETFQTTGRAAA